MSFNKSIHETISDALFDHAYTEREKFLNEGGQLAYYTTADTALSIFRGKEIWMRSATVMNDYSEVHFGFYQMREAWKTPEGNQFWRVLADISPRVTSSVENQFVSGLNDLAHDTYLTCLSKIGPNDLARELGKLSMWRAYGGDAGVALILNSTPFKGDSTALGVYSQPVIYGTSQQLAKQLGQIASRLFDAKKEIQEYLQTGEGAVAYLSSLIALSIEFLIVCLKHPAFEEENEWRVICPLKRKGYKLKQDIHCIGGIPQIVLKIPLEDDPTANLHGYSLNNLISQVLIGPTQHPEAIKAALCNAMGESGIIRPEGRVKLTYIPLRANNRQAAFSKALSILRQGYDKIFIVFKYNLALAGASISTTKLDAKLRRKYLSHGTKHGLNAQEMALMLIQQNPEVVGDLNVASETIRRWRSEGKIREWSYEDAKLALMFEFKTQIF